MIISTPKILARQWRERLTIRSPVRSIEDAFLEQVAGSRDPVTRLRQVMRRQKWVELSFQCLSLMVVTPVMVVALLKSLYLIVVAYFLLLGAVTIVPRVVRERECCRLLLKGIRRVSASAGTPPGSRARLRAARAILGTRIHLSRFVPIIPFTYSRRVLKGPVMESVRAMESMAQVALLAADDELAQLRENLARAVLRVGTGHWNEVGDLAPPATGSRPSGVPNWLVVNWQLLAAVVAVAGPIVPALRDMLR